jgi:hypothetical protein
MMFVVLFGAILGVAWRRVSSALRIEHISSIRKQCDRGSVQVLAQAMRVLETRLRRNSTSGVSQLDVSSTSTPDLRDTYTCKSSVAYDISDDPTMPNMRWYIITFTYENTDAEGDSRWIVNVSSSKDQPAFPNLPSSPP